MFFTNELVPGFAHSKISNVFDKAKQTFLHLAVSLTCIVKLGAKSFSRSYTARERIDPFGVFKVRVTHLVNDYGGLRSEYLDADGIYDPESYASILRTNLAVDLREQDNVRANIRYVNSSETGMLFNMLRNYYLLRAGSLGQAATGDYYNDGHVAVSFEEAFGSEGESKLEPCGTDFDSSDNIYENDFRWEGWTHSDLQIISASLGELKGVGPCSLAASSPAIAKYANFAVFIDTFEAWYDINAVESTIRKVVEKYRLYNAFESATYLVAQMAANFGAHTAEAVMLRSAVRETTIPLFSSMRFAVPGIVAGNLGAVRPAAMANYDCWGKSPDTMWLFSAIMNSAAEFRSVKSHGTDFDSSGELDRVFSESAISSGVGKWAVYASSALGKKVHIAEGFCLGHDPSEVQLNPCLYRVVGDTAQYSVRREESDPEGYVRLEELMDTQRQPYHSKLLFVSDILPTSKVGGVTRKKEFEVHYSSHQNALGMVRHEDIGAYMTMTRLFGYNVSMRSAGGHLIKNWADNGSRLPWSPGELDLSRDSMAHITVLEERGDSGRMSFSPLTKMTYEFELVNDGIRLEYGYRAITSRGRFPMTYVLQEQGTAVVAGAKPVFEIAAPQIISKVTDFGEVREPRRVPHPGEATGLILPQDLQPSTALQATQAVEGLDLETGE
jgi:hypothetical protein